MSILWTKKEKIAFIGQENTFIPIKYIEIVKEALKNYDDNFIKGFEKTFENYNFPLKDGFYKFTDLLENKIAREGIKN